MLDDESLRKAIQQAIESAPKRKFLETVELAINLKDIDLRDPAKRFNTQVLLPHKPSKDVSVALIGDDAMLQQAKDAGFAELISKEDLEQFIRDPKAARKVAKKNDYFISLAPLMPLVGRSLGRFLGPRGKMPTPIPPNANPTDFLNRFSRTVLLRLRQNPVIHARIGTVDQPVEDLVENAKSVLAEVERRLEQGERNIKSIYVKTTMGPAVKVGEK